MTYSPWLWEPAPEEE
jgi:hypothetical protein